MRRKAVVGNKVATSATQTLSSKCVTRSEAAWEVPVDPPGQPLHRRLSRYFWGFPPFLALVETIALAVHFQDMDMVGEAVQQSPGQAFRTTPRLTASAHRPLPRAGRRQPRGGRLVPRSGPSCGLRGQAAARNLQAPGASTTGNCIPKAVCGPIFDVYLKVHASRQAGFRRASRGPPFPDGGAFGSSRRNTAAQRRDYSRV